MAASSSSSSSSRPTPAVPWCIETLALRPSSSSSSSSKATWAVATSKLTGRVWDGHVVLVSEPAALAEDGTASVRVGEGSAGTVALNTESGNTDLVWLTADVLATTTDRGQLQLIRVTDGAAGLELHLETTYMEHDDAAVAVAQSPIDRTRVATAGWDGMVNVWTLEDLAASNTKPPVVHQHKGHTKAVVNDVDWNLTDANVFASVGSDGHAFVWDCRQKRASAAIKLEAPGLALTWSRTVDTQFYIGDQAGCVQVLDTRTMAVAAPAINPKEARPRGIRRVIQLASHPTHLAFTSDDLQVRVASLATSTVVAHWKDHTDFPRGLAESPLGLATAGWDAHIRWRALPALAD